MFNKLFVIAGVLLGFSNDACSGFLFGKAIPLKCGGTSSHKVSLLESPTNNAPSDCVYKFKPHSAFVCQIKVEFEMNLARPTFPSNNTALGYPICETDALIINNEFEFCGSDQNQHIYRPFNRTNNRDITFEIRVRIGSRVSGDPSPSWKLTVTQLECSLGSPLRSASRTWNITPRTFYSDGFHIAPNGCLQYFPQREGSFHSFSYGSGFYPGNLHYAICFRRTENSTQLKLKNTFFKIGEEAGSTGDQVDDFCYSAIPTDGRSQDYLFIPEAQITTTSLRATRFCGSKLNNLAVSSSPPGPFVIYFKTDDLYREDVPEEGFNFNYVIE